MDVDDFGSAHHRLLPFTDLETLEILPGPPLPQQQPRRARTAAILDSLYV